jgi:hypothetical protein
MCNGNVSWQCFPSWVETLLKCLGGFSFFTSLGMFETGGKLGVEESEPGVYIRKIMVTLW